MDTPTHALIPVIVYGIMRRKTLVTGTRAEKISVFKTAAVIGLVGALPDMLDPHVTLEERLNSWSHSLTAWVGFSAVFWIVSLVSRGRMTSALAAGLSLTYLSHLFGDAIAGGIGWSYPFGSHVIGNYYVIPKWWLPANFISLTLAYFVYRAIPMWETDRLRALELDKKREALLAENAD